MKVLSVVLIASLIFTLLPHQHWNGIDEENDSGMDRFFNRFYFASTTFSTVGYGDIYPVSRTARMLVMLLQFCIMISIVDFF